MNKKQSFIAIAAVAIVTLTLLSVFYMLLKKADPNLLPSALINKPAPIFQSAAIEGTPNLPTFTNESLKTGKISVVNFWASWCAPCREEHPYLLELAKAGIPVYGINRKDEPKFAREYLAKHGNPYAGIIADPTGRIAIEWGGYGTPETFVISGDGKVLKRYVGAIGQSETDEIKIISK